MTLDEIRQFLEGPAIVSLKGADIKSGGLRSGSSDCSALSSTPSSVRSLAFSIFSVKGVPQ